jgi:hypothetical protein
LREQHGAPFSVALSGAGAFDYGPYFGAFGRMGFDVSRHAGPLTATADVYLSTQSELRYMQDPDVIPIEEPSPSSASIV